MDDVKQAIADSKWWESVCKLIGATLIGFTYRFGATIQFKDSQNCCEFDGRIATYITKQAKEREDFNARVLDDLRNITDTIREIQNGKS